MQINYPALLRPALVEWENCDPKTARKLTMAQSDDPEAKPKHKLTDHYFGEYLSHVHEGDADHDHDYFDDNTALEDNPLWVQDHVTLTSVGMDIGSAGTQVVFSRLALRRLSEANSSRYVVVSRETLFQSPVALTPYKNDERIDDRALGAIVDRKQPPADVQRRGRQHAPVRQQSKLGRAAADINVEDARAALV